MAACSQGGYWAKNLHDYAKQMDVLCEYIGNKQLRDVTPTDIKAVYVHYLGYSESTIRCARILFSGLFDGAMADGYINRNPCKHESAKPHKGSVGTHRAIDTDQRVLILSTQHRLRAAVMAMLYAGLRRGEAMAIDIDRDIDFSAAIIHVREAVRFDSNQPIITTPKTEAGERDIPLVSILADELRDLYGLLLPSAQGRLCSDTAFRRAWDSYLHALSNKAHRKISIRPHDLRHSYCTMLRDTGVDLKIAMIWMGHADKDMILKVYDHVSPSRLARSVDALERFCLAD